MTNAGKTFVTTGAIIVAGIFTFMLTRISSEALSNVVFLVFGLCAGIPATLLALQGNNRSQQTYFDDDDEYCEPRVARQRQLESAYYAGRENALQERERALFEMHQYPQEYRKQTYDGPPIIVLYAPKEPYQQTVTVEAPVQPRLTGGSNLPVLRR